MIVGLQKGENKRCSVAVPILYTTIFEQVLFVWWAFLSFLSLAILYRAYFCLSVWNQVDGFFFSSEQWPAKSLRQLFMYGVYLGIFCRHSVALSVIAVNRTSHFRCKDLDESNFCWKIPCRIYISKSWHWGPLYMICHVLHFLVPPVAKK